MHSDKGVTQEAVLLLITNKYLSENMIIRKWFVKMLKFNINLYKIPKNMGYGNTILNFPYAVWYLLTFTRQTLFSTLYNLNCICLEK